MNREYNRDHMIMQLLVHTTIDADKLDKCSDKEIKQLYDKYVKEVDGIARGNI